MDWDVRRFETIDSTNRYLLDEAAAGASAGLVAVAGHQTEGRGRRGRVWDSKPGASLLVSVLFRPGNTTELVRYPQAMGLAVTDTTALNAGFSSQLKWPNDVVVVQQGKLRKLAGILSESSTLDDFALVVGCGINLNWGADLPEALRDKAVSADELAGHVIDSGSFLETLLHSLNERLSRQTWIAEAYRQRCVTLGQQVRVEQTNATVIGMAESLTDSGALIVRSEHGDRIEVTIGDVIHVL